MKTLHLVSQKYINFQLGGEIILCFSKKNLITIKKNEMKKTILHLLMALFILSCNDSRIDYADLNKITFYDFKGNEVDLDEIKKDWNETINTGDHLESLYDQRISELNIRIIQDNFTNKESLIIVAQITNKNVYSGKVIKRFKNGMQLSDRTVTCKDCGTEFQGELINGTWICANNGKSIDDCTKTSSLEY
jgi:predicted Zn-ribbon and HTH transcriptional regulator